jgi:predicted RNA binding protein YcfA (HicA-like mRNA interferase family)
VNGAEFLKKVKRAADRKGLAFSFDQAHGKGSHGTLIVGGRKTIVKDRKKDIGEGLLNAMLKQIGLTKKDLV